MDELKLYKSGKQDFIVGLNDNYELTFTPEGETQSVRTGYIRDMNRKLFDLNEIKKLIGLKISITDNDLCELITHNDDNITAGEIVEALNIDEGTIHTTIWRVVSTYEPDDHWSGVPTLRFSAINEIGAVAVVCIDCTREQGLEWGMRSFTMTTEQFMQMYRMGFNDIKELINQTKEV